MFQSRRKSNNKETCSEGVVLQNVDSFAQAMNTMFRLLSSATNDTCQRGRDVSPQQAHLSPPPGQTALLLVTLTAHPRRHNRPVHPPRRDGFHDTVLCSPHRPWRRSSKSRTPQRAWALPSLPPPAGSRPALPLLSLQRPRCRPRPANPGEHRTSPPPERLAPCPTASDEGLSATTV